MSIVNLCLNLKNVSLKNQLSYVSALMLRNTLLSMFRFLRSRLAISNTIKTLGFLGAAPLSGLRQSLAAFLFLICSMYSLMLNFHNCYYANFILFMFVSFNHLIKPIMKKLKTYFGPEGTTVLFPCLVIYSVSVWLRETFYRREFEIREHCKIEPRFQSPKEIFWICAHFLNVK